MGVIPDFISTPCHGDRRTRTPMRVRSGATVFSPARNKRYLDFAPKSGAPLDMTRVVGGATLYSGSHHRSEHLHRLPPLLRKILPVGISQRDQPLFHCATPLLQLRFACDCEVDILMHFEVHQSRAVLLIGETFKNVVLVLRNTMSELAGDPDIQHAPGNALHDVHVIGVVLHAYMIRDVPPFLCDAAHVFLC
jgi:hypothetical protein